MPRGRKRKEQAPEVVVERKPSSAPPSPFVKGDRVLVHGGTDDEPDDFFGLVISSKWSNMSGWWLDVKRDDNDRTYTFPVEFAEDIDTVGVE